MRLMISPKIPTSSGAPVMPMTPASSPAMTMGRLIAGLHPLGGIVLPDGLLPQALGNELRGPLVQLAAARRDWCWR